MYRDQGDTTRSKAVMVKCEKVASNIPRSESVFSHVSIGDERIDGPIEGFGVCLIQLGVCQG